MPDTSTYVELNIGTLYFDASDYEIVNVCLKVRVYEARSNYLEWTSSAMSDVGYIQKSNNGSSGFFTLTTINPQSAPHYLDETANNTIDFGEIEYSRIVFPSVAKKSTAVSPLGKADFFASEISRRNKILLNAGRSGNKAYAFTKMQQGLRCPLCWDEIMQVRSRVSCPKCLNTGYLSGFYDPLEVYI